MPSVYDIMMQLSLNDEASEGLKQIGESFSKLFEQLSELQHGFGALSATVMGAAGVGLLLGLNKITEAGDEMARSLNKVTVAGGDATATLEAARRATEAVPGFTVGESVEMLRKMEVLLGAQTALSEAPTFQRAAWWSKFYGYGPEGMEAIAQQARMEGLTGQRAAEFFEEKYRTLQAAQGMLSPQLLARMQQRMGIAGLGVSEDFMNVIMPQLALTMPGGRAAGGLAGNIGRLMEAFEQGPKGPHGRMRGIDPAGWRAYIAGPTGIGYDKADNELFRRDPYEWSQRMAKGFTDKFGTDPEVLTKQLGRIFTDPRIAQAVAIMMLQGRAILGASSPFEEFRRARGEAPGLGEEGISKIYERDPKALMERLTADMKQFFETIGEASSKTRIEGLTFLTEHLERLNTAVEKFAKENPEAFDTIIKITAGLGTTMVALAALRLGGAALAFVMGGAAAPIVIAAAAIATAIYLFSDLSWKDVETILTGIHDAIAKFIARLRGEPWHWTTDASRRTQLGPERGFAGPTAPGTLSIGHEQELKAYNDAIRRYLNPWVGTEYVKPGMTTWGGDQTRGGWFNQGITWPTTPDITKQPEEPDTFEERFGPTPPETPKVERASSSELLTRALLGSAGRIMYPQLMPITGGGPVVVDQGKPTTPTPISVPFLGIGGLPQPAPRSPIDERWWQPSAPQSSAMPASFSPGIPPSTPNANINVTLDVDGRTMGSVLLSRILSMYDFTETGAGGNWNSGFPNLDINATSR